MGEDGEDGKDGEDGSSSRQRLDHHSPAERGLLGDEDGGHPAPTELALDRVGAGEGALEAGGANCRGYRRLGYILYIEGTQLQ